MASNGLVFRAGRGPSFILVGLVVIVIILFYSYWGVSSKNNKLLRDVSVLQDRLRVLASRKLTSDKKGSALAIQLTQLQDEKQKIEKVIESKDSEIYNSQDLLKQKEAELQKLQEQEKVYHQELEKLRRGVNGSSSQLKIVSQKAEKLMKKFKDVKANHSALLEKITKLTAEREICQEDLQKMREELEDAKKAQVSNNTKSTSKGTVADEKESAKSKQNNKDFSDESQNKKSDVDEGKIGSEEKGEEQEKNEGKEVVEKMSKPSVVKPDLKEKKNIPTPTANSSKAGENRSKSDSVNKVKPTLALQTTSMKSKEREKRDEKNDEQKISEEEKIAENEAVEDEDAAGKLTESEEAGIDKERELEDGEKEEDDESDDTLDDKEKGQESMNSPLHDRIVMRPQLKDPGKQGHEERLPGPDYIKKLQKEKMLREHLAENPGDYDGNENGNDF